ncbi:hypothetical protein [Actinosynnema sp. NPDC023587]|uniref:hypothetical protein n=1 Tax=Actinosynnema sp. NPDC023587 TaxID=3154695 RepID=UPI0033C18151
MTRGLQYLAAWSASTAVAVALSWLGIRFVLEAGVAERPRLVAEPAQSTALATTPTTTTTVVPTTTTTTVPMAVTTTAPPETTTTTTTPPTTTTTPTATALATEEGTWQVQEGERVYLRSFRLQGGVVAIKFSPREMDPVSATPRQGFAVDIRRPADAVVVMFDSPDHHSRVEATWIDGPRWQIIEEG